MTRRRRLSEADRMLWERVTESVVRRPTPGVGSLAPDALSGWDGTWDPERNEGADEGGAASPPASPSSGPEAAPRTPRSPPYPTRTLKPEGRADVGGVGWTFTRQAPAPVSRPEPGLDRRTAERLRRGERQPDARIDLHGMTAERAHLRLDRFIARSLGAGHRCVLVITGKGVRDGRPRRHHDDAPFMAPERGVLRDAVPRWLRTGPHAARIVGIFEAHQRHGGGGAFYVYLKKAR